MRILLGHNSTYYPSQGGGDVSKRLLMEALAARGHEVRVVTRIEQFGPEGHQSFEKVLASRGVEHQDGRFTLHGVDVHTRTLDPNLRQYFTEQIASFDPDVILLDIGLPGMTGYELARKLSAHTVASRAKLDALTGYGQPGDNKQPKAAGFAGYLVKPVDLDQLRDRIEAILAG